MTNTNAFEKVEDSKLKGLLLCCCCCLTSGGKESVRLWLVCRIVSSNLHPMQPSFLIIVRL